MSAQNVTLKKREADDIDAREEGLMTAGKEVQAAVTSHRTMRSKDTVGAVMERVRLGALPRRLEKKTVELMMAVSD